MCTEELFLACRATPSGPVPLALEAEGAELLVAALLDSCASNAPRASRAAAAAALVHAVVPELGARLLVALTPALAARSGHKNRDVSEQVVCVYSFEFACFEHLFLFMMRRCRLPKGDRFCVSLSFCRDLRVL